MTIHDEHPKMTYMPVGCAYINNADGSLAYVEMFLAGSNGHIYAWFVKKGLKHSIYELSPEDGKMMLELFGWDIPEAPKLTFDAIMSKPARAENQEV